MNLLLCFLFWFLEGHRVMIVNFSLIGFILACSSAVASGALFVPGEIIIKFRDGSRGGQAVIEATRSHDQQSLTAVAKDLEAKLGLPLIFKQVLSGGRILVAIKCHELTEHVVQQLRNRVKLESLIIESAGADQCTRSSPPIMKLIFEQGTIESQTVVKKT